MNGSTTGWPRISGPLGAAAGFAAGIIATLIASLADATTHHQIGLFALALVVAGVSTITTVAGALATCVHCWLLYGGFIVGKSGTLVLDEAAAETAGLFTIIALAATAIASGGTTARTRLTRRNDTPRELPGIPLPGYGNLRTTKPDTEDRTCVRA